MGRKMYDILNPLNTGIQMIRGAYRRIEERMFTPKHTIESVAKELAEGLESGEIELSKK